MFSLRQFQELDQCPKHILAIEEQHKTIYAIAAVYEWDHHTQGKVTN